MFREPVLKTHRVAAAVALFFDPPLQYLPSELLFFFFSAWVCDEEDAVMGDGVNRVFEGFAEACAFSTILSVRVYPL